MKIQLKHTLLLCFFISLLPSILLAQKDYKWDTPEPSPTIPEEFKDADAVMIYDKEIRDTYLDNNRFFSRNTIKRRIKIQTEIGLEKYGRIIIPKKSGMDFVMLDARTIKKDGTVVELDAKTEIKAIELTDEEDYLDRSRYNIFSIPGIAIGDEVEIVSIQEGYTIERGATVVLHNFIPIMQRSFSVEAHHKGLGVMATNRNGMEKPKIKKNLTSMALTWRGENLSGLYEERGNISTRSLPHFIYELNLDRLYQDSAPPNIKTWNDLLHYINDSYFKVRIRKNRKFKEVFDSILSTAKGDTKLDKVTAIQNYMNDVKMITIPDKEASQGVEYFLEEKKADFSTLMKMYKSLFEELGMDYQIAAGRSKHIGSIDLTFPTYLQITDFLFLLPDENGNSILLPTKSSKEAYNIDEVPTELYDTKIYMISPKDKALFQSAHLKGPGYKNSTYQQKYEVKVSFAEGKLQYHAEETFSGAVSTDYRNHHYALMENESMEEYLNEYMEDFGVASVDTFSLSEQSIQAPYSYTLFYDFTTTNQVSELEEKVYKIDLANLLSHALQNASPNRLLDYYPPYGYTDGFVYAFQFDQAVKLSNKENIDRKVKNSIGSFSLSVDQVNPTTILLRSKYVIEKGRIPVGSIQQLIDLTEAAEKADNEGLIIELE